MDPQARALFPHLLLEFGEGSTTYGYPDNGGTITLGEGNACETFAQFADLDWRNPDNSSASSDQVQAAWRALQVAAAQVRQNGPRKWPGGGHYASLTTIRATQDSINALIQKRIDQFDSSARLLWPGWDDAPEPAQDVLMRLMWACGTRGVHGVNATGWPRLHAAWVAKRWGVTTDDGPGCADECAIPALDETEPGANDRARQLFLSCVVPDPAA